MLQVGACCEWAMGVVRKELDPRGQKQVREARFELVEEELMLRRDELL